MLVGEESSYFLVSCEVKDYVVAAQTEPRRRVRELCGASSPVVVAAVLKVDQHELLLVGAPAALQQQHVS